MKAVGFQELKGQSALLLVALKLIFFCSHGGNAFLLPNYTPSQTRTSATRLAVATPVNDDEALMNHIFVNDIPLLDVRAEVEFAKGAFPTSVNIPILNDEQRQLVGTCYKQQGPKAAMDLGFQLVSPAHVKEPKIQAWKDFCQKNPEGYLYCFRGGSRSQLSQKGLKDATGIDYPLVNGGYKALRTFLMEELEKVPTMPLIMIGGRTGSGKTHLLEHLMPHHPVVDLEGMANHRGSAFGGLVNRPQPTQINFENQLSIEFLKLRRRHQSTVPAVFIEEEGRRIGQRVLPLSMHNAMVNDFPVVELETPMSERVQLCVQDYVTDMFPLFQSTFGGGDDADSNREARAKFRQEHLDSLDRIQKRVPNYAIIRKQVGDAFDLLEHTGDLSGFNEPTEAMLNYYDRMYDYQADKRKGEVLFRGDSTAIIEWATSEEGRRKISSLSPSL